MNLIYNWGFTDVDEDLLEPSCTSCMPISVQRWVPVQSWFVLDFVSLQKPPLCFNFLLHVSNYEGREVWVEWMKLVVSWCTGMNTALWSPWHFLLSPSRIFAHKCIFCVSQAMCDCPFWLMFLLYGTVHRFQHVMIVPAVCGLDVVLYMAHMEFWANLMGKGSQAIN